jgi:hypothetical protein
MRSALLTCVILIAGCGIAVDAAPAHRVLTKSQYIAQADAVCGGAIKQTHAMGAVPSVQAWAGTAGTRLLSIDRAALTSLKALAPPHADGATLRRLLAGASATVAETARGINAARGNDIRAFRTHAGVVAVLTRRYQAGAQAYGFHICSHWGS